MKKRLVLFTLLAAALVLLIGACAQQQPAPAQVIKETVIVEKPVEQTVIVEKQVKETVIVQQTAEPVVVTATPGAAVVAEGEVVEGGTLHLGTQAPVVLWDPIHTQDNNSLWAQLNVFEELARIGPNATTIEPAVAESWETSEGGKVWTFKIRQGMKFSNGDPVTIQDVKFSLDRCRAPDATVNWILEAVDTIDIVDDQTLKVTLKAPSAAFLNDIVLWGCGITPQKVIGKIGAEEFASHPVGSGPFMVAEWTKGERVVLKRNPYYWGKDSDGRQLPYLDEVVLEEIQEDNTRILKLVAGELDAVTWVPYSLVDALKTSSGISVHVDPCAGGAPVALNQRVPALQDVKVRQALNYAVDKQAIMDAVFFGYATPKLSPIHPGVWFMTEKYGYHDDLEKAKQLMSESKFPDGFEANLMISAGDTVSEQIANILKDQWAKIGVNITIEPLESGLAWDRNLKKDFDMRLGGIGTSDNIDPNANWLYSYVSDGGAEAARTGWKDEEMDALFRQSQTEMDFEKRGEIYDQLQQMAMERGPFVPLYNASCSYAFRDNVHGFRLLPTFNWRLWDVWVAG